MARYKTWMTVELVVREHITDIMRKFPSLMERTFWTLGDHIRDVARMLAPIDTGALRAAISLTTIKRSDHSARVGEGMRLRPEADFAGVTHPPAVGIDIHAAAGYATFQEFGTRFNPARPFLLPAAMEAQRRFGTIFSQQLTKAIWGAAVKTYKI